MTNLSELIKQNRLNKGVGIPCFCTANEQVIRSILRYCRGSELPIVIEATCNQVNQDGGYTGMQPNDFIQWVKGLATQENVKQERIIFGGDHLGPNPWRRENADTAMEKAKTLVKQYVEAGFCKIHIDTSMCCKDDSSLSFEAIAERAAELCAVAEQYAPDAKQLYYIIGTEVPIPGGETEEPSALDVTSVERFKKTIETHRIAFNKAGLQDAWTRIVSVVTQPGVDFGHTSVFEFKPEASLALSEAIMTEPGITFEAHSTDYQSNKGLSALVKQHFFFLKVGPELTFRMREAVFALAQIEKCLPLENHSGIEQALGNAMRNDDSNWRDYYSGSDSQVAIMKIYSYSDRIRYYWSDSLVQEALEKLMSNLRSQAIPESYATQHFTGLEFGEIPSSPDELMHGHIEKAVSRYYQAAGFIN